MQREFPFNVRIQPVGCSASSNVSEPALRMICDPARGDTPVLLQPGSCFSLPSQGLLLRPFLGLQVRVHMWALPLGALGSQGSGNDYPKGLLLSQEQPQEN